MRSTKALRGYFAVAESQPTPGTLQESKVKKGPLWNTLFYRLHWSCSRLHWNYFRLNAAHSPAGSDLVLASLNVAHRPQSLNCHYDL